MIYRFGYVRRSSAERKKASYSIDSQTRIIEKKAKQNGDVIDQFFVDEGFSGSNLKRPHLQKMLREIASMEGNAVILYIWMSSRLSRNTIYTNSLRHVFDRYNVKVISGNEDWVSLHEMKNTPDKSLLPNIIGAADEAEIARDRHRTRVGLITSAESGNYTKGGKTPPCGYQFVRNADGKGRKVEIDPNFVETMLYVIHEIHDHKRSIESLAIELDARQACGSAWSFSKIYKIVTDKILYGCFETNYVKIEMHSPAYISKDYFDEMQKIIHGRKKEGRYRYLFKNLVKCNKCGAWCSEIPTIHYPRNSENSPKRKKLRKVYKYYCCPDCSRRINEDHLLAKMVFYIQSVIKEDDHMELVQALQEKYTRITKKINFINEEYDEGIIDEDYFKKEHKKQVLHMKELQNQIENMKEQALHRCYEYSDIEKKEIIRKNFKSISVDLKTKDIVEVEIM